MTTSQTGPDVATLLEAHMWDPISGDCHCGSWGHDGKGQVATWAQHHAHQAQVIREAYASWLENADQVRLVLALALHGVDEADEVRAALADLLRGQP